MSIKIIYYWRKRLFFITFLNLQNNKIIFNQNLLSHVPQVLAHATFISYSTPPIVNMEPVLQYVEYPEHDEVMSVQVTVSNFLQKLQQIDLKLLSLQKFIFDIAPRFQAFSHVI